MKALQIVPGVLVLAGVLCSCSSYQNLSAPPKVDASGLVREGKADTVDTTSVADLPWKSWFADPKLQALVAQALDSGTNVKIALSRVEASEASLGSARAAQFPSVTAEAGAAHTRTGSTLGTVSQSGTLGFSASWELDLWGRLSSASKAKYAALLESREYVNLVRTQVVASVAGGYYQLLALDKEIQVTQETIELLEKNAQTMASLKQAGSVTEAAVEQTNATLYATQLSLFSLRQQVREQENALCILLGRKPGPVERASLDQEEMPAGFHTGVPVRALARRPDVRQAELAVEVAYATTDVARASLYPTFAITSSSTFLGLAGGLDGFFSPENLMASLAASITQPVFNRAALKANVKSAEAAQKEAVLNFSQTILAAGQEVSNIAFQYGQSQEKQELRQKQIASLQKASEATELLLAAGEVNYLEVLTARQNLLTAKLDQISDQLERLSCGVKLYQALGGGVR